MSLDGKLKLESGRRLSARPVSPHPLFTRTPRFVLRITPCISGVQQAASSAAWASGRSFGPQPKVGPASSPSGGGGDCFEGLLHFLGKPDAPTDKTDSGPNLLDPEF